MGISTYLTPSPKQEIAITQIKSYKRIQDHQGHV